MKRILLFCLSGFCLFSNVSFARVSAIHPDIYGYIINTTNYPISVDYAGGNCWKPGELLGHHVIKPGKLTSCTDNGIVDPDGEKNCWHFLTHADVDNGCYDDGAAITREHNATLIIHDAYTSRKIVLGMYKSGGIAFNYCTSQSALGIKISGQDDCDYRIIVSPIKITAPYDIKAVGLGDVGKKNIDPTGLNVKVVFSAKTTSCQIKYKLNDQLGAAFIKDITCSRSDIGYDIIQDKKQIVFYCQRGGQKDSKCPWIIPNKKKPALASSIYS
ncbi:hypothetical protein L3V82_02455 [Thiotrichales bacterium 19S3-7]|nr:hypothetical protein [Thiotrichales bacterium 19S3-7]MCF6801029.1 hypothetical protein [Thiotrichales bacterium 19S3-11]